MKESHDLIVRRRKFVMGLIRDEAWDAVLTYGDFALGQLHIKMPSRQRSETDATTDLAFRSNVLRTIGKICAMPDTFVYDMLVSSLRELADSPYYGKAVIAALEQMLRSHAGQLFEHELKRLAALGTVELSTGAPANSLPATGGLDFGEIRQLAQQELVQRPKAVVTETSWWLYTPELRSRLQWAQLRVFSTGTAEVYNYLSLYERFPHRERAGEATGTGVRARAYAYFPDRSLRRWRR